MNFQKGLKGQDVKWPLTQAQIDKLDLSGVVSPRVGRNPHKVPAPPQGDELHTAMKEIEECRDTAARDVWPKELLEAYGLDAKVAYPLVSEVGVRPSVKKAALLVRMDRVMDVALLWLKANKKRDGAAQLKIRSDFAHKPFLETVPHAEAAIAQNAAKALEAAFEVKYFYGAVRPETYFDRHLTAYHLEGAPQHPEFPAGHGADFGSNAATINLLFNLTTAQRREMVMTFLQAAAFRSFAGVHIMAANICGFILGWAVALGITYKKAEQQIKQIIPELVTL